MKSTNELLNEIVAADSIESFLSSNNKSIPDNLFQRQLLNDLAQKKITKQTLIKGSYLNASYLYDILNGKKHPSRDTVIRLSFGLTLDLCGANRLLKYAGYRDMYSKDKRDAVIIFCLKENHSLASTNDRLDHLDLPLLLEK